MAYNQQTQQMMLVFDEVREISLDLGVQMMFSFDVCEITQPEKKGEAVVAKVNTMNPNKRNKIINSSYKSGDNLKGDEYRFDRELKVDPSYASSCLGDIYDVENNMVFNKVQEEIAILIDKTPELADMLDEEKKKKFNKEKVNRMFSLIYLHFETDFKARQFSSLIYIFDNVANLSGLKYASLYDMLDEEYQQLLLAELDKSYHILDNCGKSNTLF